MKKTPLATLVLVCTLVYLVVFTSALPAQAPQPDASTYFSFLNATDRKTLFDQGELTASGSSASGLPLGTKAPFAPQVRSGLTVTASTVAIEGFFLFNRPRDVDLALYNAVNAVASMEGLEYYSVSRQRYEPLILQSWRVESLQRPNKVADPVFTVVPAVQTAVIFQKDNKLGSGYSELTWRKGEGTIVITLKNLQTLNYGILPLVEPGNLQMLFVVVPLADKVAVYGVMEAKTAQLFGLERSKDESFRNRMRALASWLGQRIQTIR